MNELLETRARFKDALWFNKKHSPIIIGGAGGIGSWTALLLSRMVNNAMFIYDDDTIEKHNIGGQFYKADDIGKKKVDSILTSIFEYSGYEHQHIVLNRKYNGDAATDIMISAFDNMEARKIMAKAWYKNQCKKKTRKKEDINVFIDGRLEAEQGIIYTITKKSQYKKYMENLEINKNLPDGNCTLKSTSHSACIMAGLITTLLTNIMSNKTVGFECRDRPYKFTYELPLLNFEHHVDN